MKTKKPELLSPAGNFDSLKAAINGGADAVYLGLKEFSARKRAENFSIEDLDTVLKYTKPNDVKVYITLNTLIKNEELPALINIIDQLNNIDIDGVIVQDLGILEILLENNFSKSIQMSTQASIYGNEGAEFFEDLGVDRIVYARETPIKEIEESDNLEVEKKVFCHGALCFAYSGQCHLSSAIGGRSGNRGSCAQPCRRKYKLEKNNRLLKENYLLSTKELNTLEHIEKLKNPNIDSLKIEGRLRSPEYVYSVTKAYRNALDSTPTEEDVKNIEATFNREYTKGVSLGSIHNLAQNNPKNRGVLIGTTGEQRGNKLEVNLNKGIEIVNGDGLSFGEHEEYGTYVNGIFDNKNKKLNSGKNKVLISVNKKVSSGLPIYRSFDKKRIDSIRKEALKEPDINLKKIPIDLDINLNQRYPFIMASVKDIELKITNEDWNIQKAQKRPLTEEEVIQQFSKLGNTPFEINDIKVNLEKNIFLPKSELNKIRNKVVEDLEDALYEEKSILPKVNVPVINENSPIKDKNWSIRFDDLPSVDLIDRLDVDEIVLNLKDIEDQKIPILIDTIKKNGKKVFLTFPTVSEEKYLNKLFTDRGLEILQDQRIDGFLIPNYDVFNRLKKNLNNFNELNLEADDSLNIFNYISSDLLKKIGFTAFTVSDELSKEEIKELSKTASLPSTMIVGGKRKLMISQNCVLDCGQCGNCPNEGWYTLTNDFGDKFDLLIEDDKNTIYTQEIQELNSAIFEQSYISKFRINITNENEDQILKLIENLKNDSITENISPGNYKKGVA